MGGDHSHAVTGAVNAGCYVAANLTFRLQLIVPLYDTNGWLDERSHLPGERRTAYPGSIELFCVHLSQTHTQTRVSRVSRVFRKKPLSLGLEPTTNFYSGSNEPIRLVSADLSNWLIGIAIKVRRGVRRLGTFAPRRATPLASVTIRL